MSRPGTPGTLLPKVFGLILLVSATLATLRVSPWVGETERIPDFRGPFLERATDQPATFPDRLSPDARLELALEFRIDQAWLDRLADRGHQYAGLLQTSAGEAGIRIEMGVSRSRFTNWGISIAGRHFDLGRMPDAGRWYRLRLVAKGQSISLTIDGVRSIHLASRPDIILIDAIRAGYGYSPDRILPGEIRNISAVLLPYDAEIEAMQKQVSQLLWLVLLLWLLDTLRSRVGPRLNPIDAVPARWLWAFIYLSCFLWLKSRYAANADRDLIPDIALCFALWAAIVAALSLCRRPDTRRAVAALAVAGNYGAYVLLMAAATYLQGRATGGENGLTFDEIGALHQSNFIEAIEFFASSFSTAEKSWILLLPVLPSLMLHLLLRVRVPAGRTAQLAVGGAVALAAVPFLFSTGSGIVATAFAGWQTYADAQRGFAEYRKRRSEAPPIEAKKDETGETYVLVIGESSNRDHYSAYGYFRPTTPWLERQRQGQDGILFGNAYASYAHTVPALMQALTAANQYNRQSTLSSPTLIEVFRAAGFHTVWLSEQTMSWADTPLHTLAAEADQAIQVRSPGRIVARFREALQALDRSRNNLIIVHMMGSHADYRNRYPPDFTYGFSRTQDDLGNHSRATDFLDKFLDPYDLSVRYTDHQLAEMVGALNAARIGVHALIFVSDHGEDVWRQRFHDATNFSFPMLRIPLFMTFSRDWTRRYPERQSQLRRNRDRIFTLDLLYDTMIGLAGIRTAGTTAEYDLGDARYRLGEENALAMRPPPDSLSGVYGHVGERAIRDDPQRIARENLRFVNGSHPARFLANWADSLARANEADALGFDGIEINVGVPSLRVGHYPEIVHARTLAQFLALPAVREKRRFWLDLKLEAGQSLHSALDGMEALDRQYGLKARAIVESPEPGLGAFAERGWHTSYYFIAERWPGCLADEDSQRRCGREIASVVREDRLGAVSFDLRYYPFINRHVAPLLPPDVMFHTFGADLPSIYSREFRQRLLARTEVADRRIRTFLLEGSQTFKESAR